MEKPIGEKSPVAKMIDDLHEKFIRSQGDNGTFPKWESGLKAVAGGAKNPNERKGMKEEAGNYADGGDVPPPPMDEGPGPNDAPQPTPSLGDTSAAINAAPDTNYDFYGNTGSDQRAALYKQLLDQQRSPGNLIAQGIGGIGDAFSALGGKSTDFQDKATGISTENTANRIGQMDTQRGQKLQDMQGSQEMQMNDPKSPLSQTLRNAANQAGMKVGSLMPASALMKLIPAFGELGMKQASLGIQQQIANQTATNNKATRTQAAAKGLQDRSLLQKAKDMFSTSPETAAMQAELPGANQAAPQTGGPHGQTVTQNGHTYTWNGQTYE